MKLGRINAIQKRCAIYIRCSTLEQKKDGFSPQYQTDACRKYIQDKGYKEFKIYEDLGVSGTVKPHKRPGFSQLLRDAKNQDFSIIVFHAFDRLARDMVVAYEMIGLFREYNIQIVDIQRDIDTTTSDGKARMAMYFMFGELEHGILIERSKSGTNAKRKKLGWIGGRVPYGYMKPDSNKDSIPVINPEEAIIVRWIYDAYWDKKLNLTSIVKHLIESNVTPSKYSNQWTVAYITRILKDHQYKYDGGLINENENKICWEKILEKAYPIYPRKH